MIDRIEKIEDELNVIRYNFEFAKQYIESDKARTESMVLLTKTVSEFVEIVNEKILDLQDSFVTLSTNRDLNFKLIESHGRLIDSLIKVVGDHQKKLNSL